MKTNPKDRTVKPMNKQIRLKFRPILLVMVLLCIFSASPTVAAPGDWARVNTDGFSMSPPGEAGSALSMVVYNGNLYTGTVNYENENGCQVWRYNSGTSWTQISTSGLGDANNEMIFGMAVFNGLLYVGTRNAITGGEVWSYNGTAWAQVNTDGFGAGAANRSTSALIVFNNQLYAGTGNNARVFRYDGGTTWTQINTDKFGDADTTDCRSFAVHDNNLYVGVYRNSGTRVFRYDGGTTWTQINTDGFGDTNNRETRVMQSYNGTLYAGTSGTDTPQILRYNGGTSWTDITPAYPDDANDAVRSMAVYNGDLYVGTGSYKGVGTQIYSYNGSDWDQVNENGFGDPLNMATHSLTVFNNQLYAGIFAVDWDATPDVYFGARVWRMDRSASGAIPTLSEWGIIVLSLILAAAAIRVIRKRNTGKLFSA